MFFRYTDSSAENFDFEEDEDINSSASILKKENDEDTYMLGIKLEEVGTDIFDTLNLAQKRRDLMWSLAPFLDDAPSSAKVRTLKVVGIATFLGALGGGVSYGVVKLTQWHDHEQRAVYHKKIPLE